MTERAAQFIGDIPAQYDAGLGPVLFARYADETARRVVALNPADILETAAGTGIVTAALRARLPDARITATDLNAPMLDYAAAKIGADSGRRAGRTTFQAADACDLPFGDAAFDCVCCQFGIMFFPDKPKSYAEARRVLREGGAYVFSAWDSWAANPFAEIVHEILADAFPDDPPQFYRTPFGYHDPAEMKRAARTAGFSSIRISRVAFESPIPSPEKFARGAIYGNPVYAEIVERGAASPEALRELLAEAIAARFGPSPVTTPLAAFIVEART
ncbi:MAG: methyltransferase domain-containing protein [Parvularculaceae bacterium]